MLSKKTVMTFVLLLFVAVAAGVLVVKETRRAREVREAEAARLAATAPAAAAIAAATPAPFPSSTTAPAAAAIAAVTPSPLPASPAPATPSPEKKPAPAAAQEAPSAVPVSAKATPSRKVVVYYLRTTTRCPSCFKIETYAEAAVLGGFPEPLRSGRLEWKSFNTDEPKYAHFVKDYELFTKSVVVSEVVDGKEVRWKRLDRVWDLLGDQKAFTEYIVEEVRGYLGS